MYDDYEMERNGTGTNLGIIGILYRNVPGRTEEDHQKPQPGSTRSI
jgi:hypothetical protein